MDKMSLEEFIEILNRTENDFDILGFEGILNGLELLKWMQADNEAKAGCDVLSEMYSRQARMLHAELKKVGYFG